MANSSNTQPFAQSPALALRNLGLSPYSIMAAINRTDRMEPDIIPHLSLPPPRSPVGQDPVPLEFAKFPELPVELRLKIEFAHFPGIQWDHASFLPRDINLRLRTLGELRVIAYTDSGSTANEYFESHEFVTNTSAPAILHTCQESRTVGLTRYRLSFGTSYEFANIKISTLPQIYINFNCDRICLLWPHHFQSHKSRSFKTFIKICQDNGLRHLALNVLRDQHWSYVDLTTMIHSLEEVVLFGSAPRDGFPDYDSPNIGFINMEILAAEHPEYWKEMLDHSWAVRLERLRKDLNTFCELNKQRHHDEPASSDTTPSEQYKDIPRKAQLWEPPRIVTRYITKNGCPERSEFNWQW